MNLSDFLIQPRENAVHFDLFRSRETIETLLGRFAIELIIHGKCKMEPNQEMVTAAEALADALTADFDAFHDLVFTAYEWAADDKRWFEIYEIPSDLTNDELPQVVNGGTISVERNNDAVDDKLHSVIQVSQEWDSEHGLHFVRENGTWLRHVY